MRAPAKKANNWFETWNRRSRLRSGTRFLSSIFCPEEEEVKTPSNANTVYESKKLEDDSIKRVKALEKDHVDDDVDMECEQIEYLKVDGESYAIENLEKIHVDDNVGRGDEQSPEHLKVNGESYAIENLEKDNRDDHVDKKYKQYLKNLKVTGASYAIENLEKVHADDNVGVGSKQPLALLKLEGESYAIENLEMDHADDDVDMEGEQSLEHLNVDGESYVIENLEKDHADDDDVDVEYKQFLKHLKVYGESYAIEMVVDGSPAILKYEVEDDDSSDLIQSVPNNSADGVSSKAKSCAGGKLKRDDLSLNRDKPVNSKRLSVGQTKLEYSLLDEDFQIFMDHVRVCDGLMVLELNNNIVIRYEEGMGDEELASENENLAKEGNMDPSKMKLQPIMGSAISSDYEQDGFVLPFKDRLNDILKEPFDQNEYEELLKLANLRSPIVKYRQLRHRSRAYPTKDLGSSYFDHYPDLAEQFQHADHAQRLHLLRGFFFWLKNVSHEGAYKPWAPTSSCYDFTLTDGSDLVLPLQMEMPKG